MVYLSVSGYTASESEGSAEIQIRHVTNGHLPIRTFPELVTNVEGSVAADEEEEEVNLRGNWGSWTDFILSSIGYCVGLGNVWRFPYLCYDNGGGAFLVPYIFMLFLCGLPLFFFELSIGQFASQGAITIWNSSPLFKGIGYGMIIVSGLVAVYYNVIIAWTVYYAAKSFTFPILPWITCNNTWNTEYCFDKYMNTSGKFGHTENHVRASEEFWNNKVHDLTDTMGDIGGINWHLLGCLAVSWIVVAACISMGVKSSGKVVYFTAVFPYVVLVILFFRGVTLPGAWQGIKFYIIPQVGDIFKIKPWREAATQIFYSLGISFGGLITFASYNKFHNNCHRDAIIVALMNCCTSIFAGFVIFSIIGFMANESGQLVKDVVTSGPGLAFIAYPEAVSRMPFSQFWSFLFFVMLFTLGLDSEFATVETCVTAIVDVLPPHLKKWKLTITMGTCLLMFLLGIILVTKGGLYIFTLMDYYSAGFSLMAIAATYSIVISFIYGQERFCNDIKSMIGFTPNIYWRISWKYTSPAAMFFIVIMSFIFYTPASYDDYILPPAAQAMGWLITLSSFLVIPGYMVYAVFYEVSQGSIIERIKFLAKPSKDWGPLLRKHRIEAGYSVPLIEEREIDTKTSFSGATTSFSCTAFENDERSVENDERSFSNDSVFYPVYDNEQIPAPCYDKTYC